MLKKLVLGGVALTALTGGLATPAMANPWDGRTINVSEQNGNVTVCGNKAIGDITVAILNLNPVTTADREPVDCGIQVLQKH